MELIRAGRVTVNGALRKNPESPVDVEKDRISVDHRTVQASTKIYLMLNKPRGIVTTVADEKGRDTVYSLLPPNLPWVAPVGRLDKASEGLLLFTNDSEWSAHILAPETHLAKTYHVQIGSLANAGLLSSMSKGIMAGDEFLRVKRASILREGQRNCWLEVVLDEGKNRHIRRMLARLGVEVLRLVRVAIGPLQLGPLPKGGSLALSAAQKLALDRAISWPASLR